MDENYKASAENILNQLGEIAESFTAFDIKTIREFYYGHFFKSLRENIGSASGFTGIVEYILFKSILKYFEKELNLKLNKSQVKVEGKKKGEENYHFMGEDKNGNKFILSHDLALNHSIQENSKTNPLKLKPDIAIIKNNELIAAIEIKLCHVSSSISKKENKRIKKLKKLRKNVLIFYIYILESKKAIKNLDKSVKFIGDIENSISLKDALDSIIKELK